MGIRNGNGAGQQKGKNSIGSYTQSRNGGGRGKVILTQQIF